MAAEGRPTVGFPSPDDESTKMKQRNKSTSAVVIIASSLTALALAAYAARKFFAPRRERRSVRVQSDTEVTEPPQDGGFDRQGEQTGFGELTHRCYGIEVPRAQFSRQSLIHAIELRLCELSPAGLADFEKSSGSARRMDVGDEYDITMLGPWNGRVRVAEVTDSSFTLVTLEGHPEAGHITFSVNEIPLRPSVLHVSIESWARARDATVHAAYDTLTVGRLVQTEVWVTFLRRVAKFVGCVDVPEVDIQSEELSA